MVGKDIERLQELIEKLEEVYAEEKEKEDRLDIIMLAVVLRMRLIKVQM